MPSIADFPFPMPGPRRPSNNRLRLPPDPRSGQPPDMMEILMEAATHHPPNPRHLDPEDMSSVKSVVNSPVTQGVPEEELLEALLNFTKIHADTGTFPGFSRVLRERLSDMLISSLDTEAKLNPTLSRMLMNPGDDLSVDSIMALEGGPAKLSNAFNLASPLDSPDQLSGIASSMLEKLKQAQPDVKYGAVTSLLENTARNSPVGDLDEAIANNMHSAGPELDTLTASLSTLKTLGDDPESSLTDVINTVLASNISPQRLLQTLIEALEMSGIGSGQRRPGMDLSTEASLAGDIDPTGLVQNIYGSEDPDLIFNLMGMNRQFPRRGAG